MENKENIRFVVFFLLGDPQASECYMRTFWNNQSHLQWWFKRPAYTAYEDGTD